MNLFKILFLTAFFSITSLINAQKVNLISNLNCPVSQNDLLLSGKPFASAPPILLRVFNEEYEYAVVQLGKRKSSIYLYFKIFSENVCVKKEQPLELYFKTGEMYILKNSFQVNCDGTAVLQLSNKDIKKIKNNTITTIKFFTLKKDFEFSPSEMDNQNLSKYLNCLKIYKLKNR